MVHAVVVRSYLAHARLVSIDVSDALANPWAIEPPILDDDAETALTERRTPEQMLRTAEGAPAMSGTSAA